MGSGVSYAVWPILPTVAFAVVEGAFIFVLLGAVPAVLVGLGAVLWQRLRRR